MFLEYSNFYLYLPTALIFTVVVIISTYTDLKERLIYNNVTYPALILGFFTNIVMLGLKEAAFYALAASIILVCFFVIFIISPNLIGGGDIKLLTVSAMFFGFKGFALISWYSILFGGVVAFVWALSNGYLVHYIETRFRALRRWWRGLPQDVRIGLVTHDRRADFPFAVAILLGWFGAVAEALDFIDLFRSVFEQPSLL